MPLHVFEKTFGGTPYICINFVRQLRGKIHKVNNTGSQTAVISPDYRVFYAILNLAQKMKNVVSWYEG